jgi:hypothetical protein
MNGDAQVWRFTKAELTALLVHVGDDTTRPNVCALWFDMAQARVYGTDGARAAVCRRISDEAPIETKRNMRPVAAAEHAVIGVMPDALRRAAKQCDGKKGSTEKVVVTLTPQVVKPDCHDCTVVVQRGDVVLSSAAGVAVGSAPPIDYVIPKYDEAAPRTVTGSAWFNIRYLQDLELVVKACPQRVIRAINKVRDNYCVKMWTAPDDLSPIRFDCAGLDTEWTVVIMPSKD